MGDRGAAAVEMALVLPLLLLLLFGIIDFGRMLNAQLTLTEAAHDGARAASVGADPAVRARQVADGLDITVSPGDCVDGARALTVTHDFTFITPVGLIGGGFDGEVELTGRGVMPCP
ncbi:TadE/TadG family type IV pilus assembly protein [Micromonospora sp. NPDC000089]|uniref:TadE/TadG family type IV pilus assembly protein n=1 Tax=Micromonospora sp. NPDC000089 TaxID=3364213 RepID=UPI0036770184